MTPIEFEAVLQQIRRDGRLSRSERKALRQRLIDADADSNLVAELRHRAFDAARAALRDGRDADVVDWLEDLVKALDLDADKPAVRPAEAYFSPGNAILDRLVTFLGGCRDSIDICVFTLTDDRIASAVADAHRRGARVRVITDNDKAWDLGSDVERLQRQGVAVKVDTAPDHMHHKFALFDGRCVVTGSYNWTRSAADHNWENLIASWDRSLVGAFQQAFDDLWATLS